MKRDPIKVKKLHVLIAGGPNPGEKHKWGDEKGGPT